MNIDIEERGRGDREDLIPVLRESFSGIYLWHARRILRSRATVLAAMRGRIPIGLAMMKMLSRDVGYVYYLALARAERRLGVGGLLLDRCLTSLFSLGVSTILACVTDGNIPSERLVISRGFVPCTMGDLLKRFGALKALGFWIGMTVAPGEEVFVKLAQSTW